MKKKYLSIVYLLILTIGTILSIYMPKVESAAKTDETVIIPKEAIRLRILANSDKKEDQDVKRLIRDEVNKNITGWVEDLTSLEEARKVIQLHLPDIQETAGQIMDKQGLNQTVKVSFKKAKFPTKLYGQYLYPAGEYEAIVITLGEGQGANWWCVLFPPLCFLDFSNGTAVTKSPYEEEDGFDTQQNNPTDNFIEKDETEDKPIPGETEESDNIPERVQGEIVEAPGQMYVSQDESPVVVKSFFMELITDLF
ncbi:stage II sporulation protein R [Bacillus sp. V5-8f]|uniref:stage II sporulation protein R n=1 Tax=Bacillus sp. V5-8f TaxID=2053044 RepID=UPI000C780A90|nr:stage II sporulation protein R [Bacillus sp. V5-8f]PLT35880.1 stage II sporulation protein R [Bacillus sp. V5-8f]